MNATELEVIRQNLIPLPKLIETAVVFLKARFALNGAEKKLETCVRLSPWKRGIVFTPFLPKGREIHVSWADIGFSGIKSLDGLFSELTEGRNCFRAVAYNSHAKGKPKFSPNPCDSISRVLFLPEPWHELLFEVWTCQRMEHVQEVCSFTPPPLRKPSCAILSASLPDELLSAVGCA